MKYKYLFGPVPSRRLGISLGVDVVPYKTCTFDCIYCECGMTTGHTLLRKPYVEASAIIEELEDCLSPHPRLDYITFSGGGEPTLNSDLGKIVDFLKNRHPSYRVALLTNGSLLWDPRVREDVRRCDLIIPSLDAVSRGSYEKINRPCPKLKIEKIIEGIKKMARESEGEVWIEVFMVPGINDNKEEIGLLKRTLIDINPDRVQLNTLDRPGAESWVVPASQKKLREIADNLKPLKAEVIAKPGSEKGTLKYSSDIEEKIVAVLKRRPCTAEDLSRIFSLHINVLNNYLREMEDSGKIISDKKERGVFFKIKDRSKSGSEK